MPTNFWTWFWPSFWMSGWNNQQLGGRQQLQKPTKQQKFPWLDADQIKRLESLTSDPQEQQKLYQQAIALKSQRDMDENRIATENEMTYRSMSEKDTKQKNYMQSNVRLEQLADLTKKKFWLNADADTQGVINWLMQYAQDKGVSMDSLNDYLAWYNERFLYDTWLKEESTAHKIWQTATDIIGWAYDSVTWLPRFLWKWAANAIGWVAKQFWADEQKTDELVQSYKDYLDNEMSSKDIWADQESLTYSISKWVWDVTQVLAWEWLIKAWVQSTVKWWQLLNSLKNAPTWQKMAAWWLEWIWDMTLYSIISESRLPTKEELALWWWIGTVIPWAWAVYKAAKPIIKKWTQKVAAKLELSGMLNPAKLNAIKNQLVEEWADLASAWLKGGTAEDVGTWMIERWFKGDKPTIINDLWEYAQKSHKLKREVLGASETLHNVDSAKKSLKAIYDTISDVPWLENKVKRVEELMAKEQHTLSELDEIKSILDDTVSIYTNAGDAKAWAVKKWLDAVRKDLRKYIEDAASKEWLGNIKMLNNETQVAKWLQDAISRKDSADAARELLSVFDKGTIGWALAWGTAWWPFDNDSVTWKIWNIIVWALAWKYLFSTKTKTQLASLLNKLSGGSKKELERLIAWDLSLKKLSNKTQKELGNVFEELKLTETKPTEMTEAEYQALLKKYSNSDLPALEFKEWVDDAWKNILAWDSEKIIATPEWVNIREWQIWELPSKNVNYPLKQSELNTSEDVYKYAQQNKESIFKEYADKHGWYVNPDDFRDYINDWKRLEAAKTHEWASSLADEYFDRLVAENPNGKWIVIAWWPWGWKGTSLNKLSEKGKINTKDANIIVDKTKWNKELKKMLDAWMEVDYYVVVPNVDSVISNIIGRAARGGAWWRTLPINSMWIPTHKNVVQIVKDLYKEWLETWKFNVKFIDNTWKIENINIKEWLEWYKLLEEFGSKLDNLTPEIVEKEAKKRLDEWKITPRQYKELIASIWWILFIWSMISSENVDTENSVIES